MYRNHLLFLPKVILLVCLVLLFSQCQSLTDEDPQPIDKHLGLRATASSDVLSNGVSCDTEVLASGEIIQICMPENWNGELILYAPGYTSEFEPLHLAPEAGLYGPMFTSMNYAFATTSYSNNGLAVQSGIVDMLRLRSMFIDRYQLPDKIYLTGASEGGLVTTLAVERYPEKWSGGLSLCGPCGDFQMQLNYYGNFRVLFDYFFPGVLPGTVVDFPDALIANWQTVYVPAILYAISQDPVKTLMLLNTAQAPYDPANPASIAETVISVLTYNIYIRDAIVKLGGQPFDNQNYTYSGTGSATTDALLNQAVQRFSADKEATKNIKKFYETKGNVKIPLVKAHTTLDPIQPFRNLLLYLDKVPPGKQNLVAQVPVQRYGHCTFTPEEVVYSFNLLLQKVSDQEQHPLAKVKEAAGKSKQKLAKAM